MKKEEKYLASIREIAFRLKKGGNLFADLGNLIAVIQKRFTHFWIGFYFWENDRLVLGPFQGPPACVFLPVESGVCASCAREKRSLIVPDVHQFPGHIACDPRSKSEITVPFFNPEGVLKAVMDIDSDTMDYFDDTDRKYLEKIADLFQARWVFDCK